MKKQDWTGIHFLEKTSYSDGKKNQAYEGLWFLIAWVAFILIQFSVCGMFFHILSMSFSGWSIFLLLLMISAVLWGLSYLKRQYFWIGMASFCAFLLIFSWMAADELFSAFTEIAEGFSTLMTVYQSGGSAQGPLEGEASFSLCLFLALLLCLYGCACYFGLRSAFAVLIPGIAVILLAFLVGESPSFFWLAVFAVAGVILVCGSYPIHHFGKYGMLSSYGNRFFIRGEKGVIQKIGAKVGIIMAIVLLLCIGASSLTGRILGAPSEETLTALQSQIRSWVNEQFDLSWGRASTSDLPEGDISGGDLASVGDREYSGDEQIIVTVGTLPESELYIKAFVGDYYEDNWWLTDDSGDYENLTADLSQEEEAEILDYTYSLFSDFGQDYMIIEKVASFGDFAFYPYAASVSQEQGWVDDLYISSSDTTSSYSYSPMFYPLVEDYESLTAYARQEMASNLTLSELEEKYSAFVYDHYTQVSSAEEETLTAFASEIGDEELLAILSGEETESEDSSDSSTTGADMEDSQENATTVVDEDTLSSTISYVRALLSENCTYTLTPGSLPEGEDFVEYFLLENQEGYCMHYATAAVLLFREWGVPARYVEGYIFVPENFSETEDGYEATAYDYQSHAWVEIYLDDVGWLPVEVTPTFYEEDSTLLGDEDDSSDKEESEEEENSGASGGDEDAESESTDDESSENDEEDAKTAAESEAEDTEGYSDEETEQVDGEDSQSEGTGEFSDQEEENGSLSGSVQGNASGLSNLFWKILIGILIAVLVLLVLAAIAVVHASSVEKKRNREMRSKNHGQAILAIYHNLLNLLDACGYPIGQNEDMHAYFERVAKKYDFVKVEECDQLISLVNRAAFGRGETQDITTEEWRSCWILYTRMRKGVYQRQKFWKKVRMKYFNCV